MLKPEWPIVPALIEDPTSGVHLSSTDVDGLAEAYDRIERVQRDLRAASTLIRIAIGRQATADTRTQRVRGEKHRIKVEMPDPVWSQPRLKELWSEHPVLAPKFLRIEKLGPIAREVTKLRSESGPVEFNTFRDRLLAAEEAPTAPPRIVIESATEVELDEQEREIGTALAFSLGVK